MYIRPFVFLVLISLSFSAYIEERPWNEPYYSQYCPYVFNIPPFPEFYSTKDMHPVLDSLNLQNLIYGKEVYKEVELARKNYGDANEAYLWVERCGLVCPTLLPYKLSSIILKILFSYKKPTTTEVNELFSYGIDIIFQTINPFFTYPLYWKITINSALDALEKSFRINDAEWNDVYSIYQRMEYMGLCDQGYTGKGSAECLYSKQVLSALGHTEGGRVGAYSRAFSNLNTLKNSFYNQKPDFTPYSKAMEELWGPNGSITYAREIKNSSLYAINSTMDSLESAQFTTEALATQTKSSIQLLEEEKIDLISAPRSISTVNQESFLESVRSFKDAKRSADFHLSYAKKLQAEKPRGWVAEAFRHLQESELLYSKVNSEVPLLLEDAKKAVSSKRDEASSSIAEIQDMQLSLKQKERLEKLKSTLSSSLKLPLGEQYILSQNIINECDSIKEEIQSGSKAILSYKLSMLKELMEKANKDGIPIEEEKQRFILMEENGPTEKEIQEIWDSIILKASIKYAQVPLLREDVYSYLSTGVFPDLEAKVRKKELGIVYTSFSFALALGNLYMLQEFYINVLNEIKARQGEIALSSLIIEYYPLPIRAILDEPSTILATIHVTNPTDYSAIDANTSIPFPLPVLASDIENVKTFSYKNGMLRLWFDLSPHSSKTIKVSKKLILASTTKVNKYAEGKYGSAYVSEERSIFLDIDCDSLEVPFTEEGSIDGVPFYNSIILKPIKQGKHVISYSYVIADAYNAEYSGITTTPVSGGTSFSYVITVSPSIDLDVLYLPIEYGANVEPITYQDFDIYNSYVVITNVHRDEQVKMRVFWTVENLSEEINLLENELEHLNLTDSEQLQFNQIIQMTDSAEKAKLLISLKKTVDKRLLEEAKKATKLAQEKEALLSLIQRYSSALSLANSLGETVISPTISSDLSALLEANRSNTSVDFSIEKKRIKEFKNMLYDTYYSLKENSYNCSSSLQNVDPLLSSLELSPSLETAVRISAILQTVRNELSSCDSVQFEGPSTSLLKEVESLISKYNNEYADAKELGLTSLLPYTLQGVESSYQKAKKSASELQRFKDLLTTVMQRLKQKAEDSAASLESSGYDTTRIRGYIKEEKFIKAISEAQNSYSKKAKDNNLLIISIVALIVLGAVAYFYIKNKDEKKLRRLKKI